jgi:uncharacterized secreted protein with C-terminal beta-propeller domain
MAETSGGGAKAALLALLVLGAAVAVVVADDTTEVGAAELASFSSCEELSGWMTDAQGVVGGAGGGRDMATAGMDVDVAEAAGEADSLAATPGAGSDDAARQDGAATSSASGSGTGTGTTNVIVEGIDELDRVEQIDGERLLAVGETSLHLIDIASATSVASAPVPLGAQVSFDPERSQVWVAGSDGARSEVSRYRLDGDAFSLESEWSTDGMLLTARRSAGGFHAVMTEGFGGVIPFRDGPVACDEVLHPTGPATPEATLIVTLPAEGALEPTAATEIVGAGRFVHLTDDAVFVATPLWEAAPATSLHRFDLDTLAHTGSGRVEGSLLNEFALSLHDGHLRVAVTHGGGRMIAVDGPAVDVGVIDVAEDVAADGVASDVAAEEVVAEEVVGEALNEVVVLDTEGELDVVGRTARFGLPDETLHGIRFVGTTAYAVTFLQTDPFYVIDLTSPTGPQVVGEVKLPGFSAYLHPVGDGHVVGFGPDGEGMVAAKLFDVSDPTAPVVVDSVELGQESPVVWDHHAFLGLGEGRFAVPGIRWEPVESPGCTEQGRAELEGRAIALEQQLNGTTDQAQLDALYRELDQLWSDPCLQQMVRPVTSVIELEVTGGALEVASRTDVRSDHPGERVLRGDAGWAVYSTPEVVVAPDDGPQASIPLR